MTEQNERRIRTGVITRRASGRPTVDEVAAYLPSNYKVTDQSETTITISGEDFAGWTMDGYVIPRLASGLITVRETTETTDPELSEILVRYRAMVHAERTHARLRREVAERFNALSEDQQHAYVAAVERIEEEDRASA